MPKQAFLTLCLWNSSYGWVYENTSSMLLPRTCLHFHPSSQGGAGIDCQLMVLFQHDIALAVELLKAVRHGQVKHQLRKRKGISPPHVPPATVILFLCSSDFLESPESPNCSNSPRKSRSS